MGLLLAIYHLKKKKKKNDSHIHVYLPLILKRCKDVENFATVYICE